MPRIPVRSVDDAPGASKEPLRRWGEKFDKVLGIHGEMARGLVVQSAYTGVHRAITEHGGLDGRTREAIAVGAVDHCACCQSDHTVAGRAAGWAERTAALRALEGHYARTDLGVHADTVLGSS